jgi:hypothetical protein
MQEKVQSQVMTDQIQPIAWADEGLVMITNLTQWVKKRLSRLEES